MYSEFYLDGAKLAMLSWRLFTIARWKDCEQQLSVLLSNGIVHARNPYRKSIASFAPSH